MFKCGFNTDKETLFYILAYTRYIGGYALYLRKWKVVVKRVVARLAYDSVSGRQTWIYGLK